MPEIKIYRASEHASLMDAFMSEAQAAGLMNNANPKILKLDRMEGKDGYYWITLENGRIVSMSGVQHLPEIGIGVDRLMFRTATLPDFRSAARPGLSTSLQTSWEWTQILPLQIDWAREQGATRLVMTTNTPDNAVDPSGRMFRVDRVFKILERQGIVSLYQADMLLYGARQNVWELTPAFEAQVTSI
jgi:hypothetical protein